MKPISKKARYLNLNILVSAAFIFMGLLSCSSEPEYQEIKTERSDAVTTGQTGNKEQDASGNETTISQGQSTARGNSPADTAKEAGDPESVTPTETENGTENLPPLPLAKEVVFQWDSPESTDITSYLIKVRDTGTGNVQDVTTIETGGGFDLSKPEFSLNIAENSTLSSLSAKIVCFTLVAINSLGESLPSDEACIRI